MAYALKRQRLWYERRGQGEPLLLITGFAVSAAVFEPVRPLYERHFECVVYDNRGAGALGLPVGALRTTASLLALRHERPSALRKQRGRKTCGV